MTLFVAFAVQSASAWDWPMWGGTGARNNVAPDQSICNDFDVGRLDRKSGKWEGSGNVKWVASLGSQSFGNPVVAGGRVFVGTNNGAGWVKRFPNTVDLGCLICFRESDGKFLWQHSNAKLATGRVHDREQQGVFSAPLVEDDRLWYVSNRGEVVCLDTEGFHDGVDDGMVTDEWSRLSGFSLAGRNNQILKDHLTKAFAENKINLPKKWYLSNRSQTRWKITHAFRVNGDVRWETDFEIQRQGDQLDVFEYPPNGKVVFSVASPDYSVDAEEMLPLVRDHLKRFRAEMPAETNIRTVEADEAWSLAANFAGQQREVVVRRQGEICRVDIQLSPESKEDADVVWRLDMMNELGVSQHKMATCAPTAYGDVLFICTSNGVDHTHQNLPSSAAPSFIAVNKHTGKLLWSDSSPGGNIVEGQWSSPAVGVFDGVTQVVFAAGDGWVYSFRADKWDKERGRPIPLWRFDGNPKTAKWLLGGRGRRNTCIAVPVIHDGRVYITMGQDPEWGEGAGDLWCIDPTKRGDISSQLAMRVVGDQRVPIPFRGELAVDKSKGEVAVDNPNSGVIWHYTEVDRNRDGEIDFEETFHRSIASPAIKDGLLFIGDFSGLVHCLDAKTGDVHWTSDLLAACWTSPLIVNDQVLIGDEDGDLAIFQLSADPKKNLQSSKDWPAPLREINLDNSLYTVPVAANNVLYIANRTHLFAIAPTKNPLLVSKPERPDR